jgi:hypothetical protein
VFAVPSTTPAADRRRRFLGGCLYVGLCLRADELSPRGSETGCNVGITQWQPIRAANHGEGRVPNWMHPVPEAETVVGELDVGVRDADVLN